MAARNERGSEQLPYEFSSTYLAHLKRGITERKWVEACSWMESRLSKHHAYRPRKSKAVASRFYQLRTGHALIGPYLKKIGKRASDACWWCDRGVKQPREHLFKSCKKWKSQQAILCAEVRKKTKKRKGQVQISELFVEEKCSPAVLDFLRSTGVGRTVPREGGENEEEDDQDGASESSGAEDSMCFLRCFLLCFLRCFLLCFCVYSLADSGERRKPRRTGHFGVRRGQDKVMAEHGRIQNDGIKKKKKKRKSGLYGTG